MALKLEGVLLGAGNIALRGHAPQWIRDPWLRAQGVEIVAVADLSALNLEAARTALPGARLYQDAHELLEREHCDFVDICTPPFTHRALVEAATRRGLHVVCEKPVAPSLAEVQAVASAVRASGVVFQPCHQYHFSPQWQQLRAWLPRLGRIYLVEYEVDRTAANPGNANWDPSWRTDPKLAGGGILFDHGAHIFYQLRAVLGEPRSVQGIARTLRHSGYAVEDSAFVVLDFAGCLAHVRLTWAARRRAIRFRFVGEAGQISGEDECLRLDADVSEEARFDEGLSGNSSHSEWYAPLFRDFVERVQTGARSSDALDEAVYVTRVIERAYESSRQKCTLPFEEQAAAPEEFTPVPEASAPPARPDLQRSGLRIGGLAVMVLACAWAFHDVDRAGLGAALAGTHAGWIALAAALNVAVLYSQAWRWFAVLRPLSPSVTLGHAFEGLIMGFAASAVVPTRAGELARVEWLGRRTGLPHLSVAASILLDHVVNALGLLVALALLPLFLPVPLWLGPGAWMLLALFVAATWAVLALRPRGAGADELARPRASALARTGLRRLGLQLREGLLAVRDRRALLASIGASLVSWGLEIGVVMLSLRAVGLHLPLAAGVLALLSVNIALAVPLAPPGNVGTLEAGATLALLPFGVDKERALAFALCYHLLQVVPILLVSLLISSRAAARARRGLAAT